MRPDNLELRHWKGLNVVDQYGRIYKQDPQTKELTRLPENKKGKYAVTSYRYKGKNRKKASHRIVAEAFLGRQLYEGETVHHRDANQKHNHTPGNLVVLSRWAHNLVEFKKYDVRSNLK